MAVWGRSCVKSLKEAAAELMIDKGMPAYYFNALPEIRITGMRNLVLESHRGVRAFAEDSVLVETCEGLLHIRGQSLVMKSMTLGELNLQGKIFALELIDSHAK